MMEGLNEKKTLPTASISLSYKAGWAYVARQNLLPWPPSLLRLFYLVVTEEGTGIVGSKVKGQLWG